MRCLRRLVVAVIVLVVAAGGLTGAAAAQSPVPTGPTDRIRLDTLPAAARFRWANPSTVFTGLTEGDVERAMGFESHKERLFFLAVLDASGWRPVPDSAEYELIVATHARTRTVRRSTPDPRNAEYVDPCRGLPPQLCQRPPRPNYPPIVTRESVTEIRKLYAVVRRRDGATRWWVVLGENAGNVPADLLRMLRNGQER